MPLVVKKTNRLGGAITKPSPWHLGVMRNDLSGCRVYVVLTDD